MKAVILARVSTQEQEEGHSIDAQLRRLQEYADKKELQVLKTFRIIESSTQGNRKEFQLMIEYIKSQKEPVALIADAVDRVQRGFKESVLLDELRRQEKVSLHFLREGIVLDKEANSRDIMMWDFAVMGAKTYVLAISDNVKRSIEFKIRNGEVIGPAPVGYLNVAEPETGKKNVVQDPVRALLVRKTFELYSTGNYSLNQLSKIMREQGLTNSTPLEKPASRTFIDYILHNPFYYGEMKIKGQLYKHKYEPIITKWLFDKCEEVRQSWHKKPFKHGSKPFVFRGLIKCSYCGCTISSDRKKDRYTYLFCTQHRGKCGALRVREEVISEQVKDVLKSLKMPQDLLMDFKEHLRTTNEAEYKFHQEDIRDTMGKIEKIKARIKQLFIEKLDKSITDEEYDNFHKDFRSEQDKLEVELAMHSKADKEFYLTITNLLDISTRAYELYESSKLDQKRQLLNFMFSNLKLEGKKLIFNLKKPFDVLVGLSKTSNWLPGSDSNISDD
ncbi:MAG: recombinase [Candidatus Berkelbacteria bacterium]|nr:recombinase [Candidatus Berkelbacteria bacterium]